MGVILDSSVLIAGERRRDSVVEVLGRVQEACGPTSASLSAITVVELTHGIYRAQTKAQMRRRELYVEELVHAMAVHPVTLEIARLAGRIHGEQMGLVIGATALYLGFDMVTLNAKHFRSIPGLTVITL